MIGAYKMMFLQFELRRVTSRGFDPHPLPLGPQVLHVFVVFLWHGRNAEEPGTGAVICAASAALHEASLHHFTTVLLHVQKQHQQA